MIVNTLCQRISIIAVMVNMVQNFTISFSFLIAGLAYLGEGYFSPTAIILFSL